MIDPIQFFHVNSGGDRLLNMMLDAGYNLNLVCNDCSYENASKEFQKLFDQYTEFLQLGAKEAIPYWQNFVKSLSESGDVTTEAVNRAFDLRMAGPASDATVVWIVRLFWLEISQRNKILNPEQRIRPEYILFQWLVDKGELELQKMLCCMPYWPIGIDKNEDWC